tara:strand:+ start:1246 stop:3864 length:2619 start_codon:yes stop_codon:yes gene_type:complete
MATYYIDPENGNNSNDGTSFANRKLTFTGLTPTAGDEIRFIGSPDPTTLGTGKIKKTIGNYDWGNTLGTITYSTTAGATNFYFSGGTWGGTDKGHNLVTGDTVVIFGNSDSKGNVNGTWEVTVVDNNNFKIDGFTATSSGSGSGGYFWNASGKRIQLTQAPCQTIASTGPRTATWTASTNATCSHLTNTSTSGTLRTVREHDRSDKIEWTSSFGTGKVAYFQLPSALNLSNYQQVSLLYSAITGGGKETGNYSIRLCTDTSGDTSVHTVPLCDRAAGSSSQSWIPTVKDFATNLNSSIQSVALYVDRDEGAQSIVISNIVACKASSSADSLTHRSLVGLGTSDDKQWYPVESINGTRLMLCGGADNALKPINATRNNGACLYWSASNNSATIKKRECIIYPYEDTASTDAGYSTYVNELNNSSMSTTGVVISGGWDRTSMSTQNLDNSFIDGTINQFTFMRLYSVNGYRFRKLGLVRWRTSLDIYGNYYGQLKDFYVIQSGSSYVPPVYLNGGYWNLDVVCNNLYFRFKAISIDMAYTYAGNYYDESGANSSAALNNLEFTGASTNVAPGTLEITSNSNTVSQVQFGTLKFAHINGGSTYSIKWDCPFGIEATTVEAGYCGNESPQGFLNLQDGNHIIETLNCEGSYAFNVSSGASLTVDHINNNPNNDWITQPNLNNMSLGGEHNSSGTVRIKDTSTLLGRVRSNSGNKMYLNNTTLNYPGGSWLYTTGGEVYARNSGGYTYYTNINNGNVIIPETSTRHTASGVAWNIKKKYNGSDNEVHISDLAVKSGSQVTVSVWIYPTGSNTNSGLKVDGTSIGIADVTSRTANPSSSSWYKQTLNFTPASAGIAKIYLIGGTHQNTYFDDMEASQA